MSRQELLAKIYSDLVVKHIKFVYPFKLETTNDFYRLQCKSLYRMTEIAVSVLYDNCN